MKPQEGEPFLQAGLSGTAGSDSTGETWQMERKTGTENEDKEENELHTKYREGDRHIQFQDIQVYGAPSTASIRANACL